MKRKLFWAALVGVAFTSCVSEDGSPVDGEKKLMRFDAPVFKTQSRANVLGEITGVKYPAEEDFKVYAYSYTGKFAGSGSTLTPYFNESGEEATNVKNSDDTPGNYWQTENVHYWPDAAHNLAFVAYSPADASGTVTHDAETGLNISGFQVQNSSDQQYDLMYSNRIFDRNVSNNGNSAVPLVFNHALTSIVFSATRAESSPETTITNIVVTGNFATQGDFTQGIIGTTTDGVYSEQNNANWTSLTNESVSYAPTFTEFKVPIDVPTQFTSGTSAILTIPQNVPADAKVAVTYTTKTGSGTLLSNTKEILLKDFVGESSNDPVTTWEMGKRYIYRFSFGATTRIYFEPTVTDWVKHETLVYTINPGA